MSAMKMGNIAPRAGIHMSCHSRASLLTITLPRLPDAITLPLPTCPERLVLTTILVLLEL